MKIKNLELNTMFPEFLKFSRESKDITQQRLSDNSFIDRTAISRMENGVITPTLENFLLILSMLGYDVLIKEKKNSDTMYRLYIDSDGQNKTKIK